MRQHSVGSKIAELREKRHLTQAQLAEELHFTHQTISNWERGVSMPDLETAAKLAEFFGVSADELLFGKVKTAPAPTPAPGGSWTPAPCAITQKSCRRPPAPAAG